MAKPGLKPRLGGAIYVLPNLITTGNLFFGFFSIVKCLQGDFAWAASAILLASIFDVLDGRVARLTKGTSEFGVQYDSLCDLVSFGLAPSFLMYQFVLHDMGRAGWIICFLFLACGALRLARFNVQSSVGKTGSDFTGLPIPMAALFVACFVALMVDVQGNARNADTIVASWIQLALANQSFQKWFLAVSGILLAVAMVSNVAYRSHKVLHIRSIKPFRLLVGIAFIFGFIAYHPELFGFSLAFVYAVSGPIEWALGWKKATDEDEIFEQTDEADAPLPGADGVDSRDEDQSARPLR